MDKTRILQADFLDIVFDNRNKDYGAYELRRSYPERVKQSLLIAVLFFALIFGGSALAGAFKNKDHGQLQVREVTLNSAELEKKEPEPIKQPEKKQDPPEVKSEKLVPPTIAPDEDVPEPPPSQDDLKNAKIDDIKRDGIDDVGITDPAPPDDKKGIIDTPVPKEDNTIYVDVQVPAKFNGNWKRFLESNLRPEVPIDNGAPEGSYSVVVRFVVDKEGNVSEIQPMTSNGYGMEDEARRVLQKASKMWDPAVANGYIVKAYHKQTITFVVTTE
ncbi:MAG: energy transducer TonB [Chitinophagaceae bacterium]|nr:energy transducer TonB [Chitinophagaceae bacterium]MBL0334785.1 energy transducer TonB [Chitinophagaceae bacterium]